MHNMEVTAFHDRKSHEIKYSYDIKYLFVSHKNITAEKSTKYINK